MRHLLLMAKAPIPGHVKTRLVPPLTIEQAAALYEAMLTDTVARLRRRAATHRVHVAVSPATCDRARFPAAWHVFPQAAGDLGARLHAAFHETLTDDASPVVAIGVDSPTLPWSFLTQAFAALERADLALGSTEDGGCYAIGLRQLPQDFFAGIPWSTERVCQALASRARQLGLAVRHLPRWYDVDTMADVERHWSSLIRTRRAPQTRAWLLSSVATPSIV